MNKYTIIINDFLKQINMTVKYSVYTNKEHVLKCTEMWLGSKKNEKTSGYTYSPITNTCEYNKSIIINNGILKMFDEVISNAFDNKSRDDIKNNIIMTYIKVNIDDNKHKITVENNGYSIPLTIDSDLDNRYIPDVIFNEMYSSSNYNLDRTGAGINGLGVKLTNILSSSFEIKIVNSKQKYYQISKNNCSSVSTPKLTKTKKQDYVRISFVPDFDKLSDSITQDVWLNTVKFINRRIYDSKCLFDNNIKIYINNKKIPDCSFIEYSNSFYVAKPITKKKNIDPSTYSNSVYIETKTYSMFIALSNKLDVISFINGVSTQSTTSAHIKFILKEISSRIIKKYKIQNDSASTIIKGSLFIVISAHIKNPTFSSQSKDSLNTYPQLESDFAISDSNIESIYTTLQLNLLLNSGANTSANAKIKQNLKNIEKLIEAENAGKSNCDCTLFICEGDSAASLAKIGMTCKNIGHKNFGCYPLTGKIINAKNATIDKITKNKVIINLMSILGLEFGKTYKSTKLLRYQHIVMLKDADADGASILALVYNFFDQYFRSLLEIEDFFYEFITPMIKIIVPLQLQPKVKFVSNGTIVYKKSKTSKTHVIYPFYNEIQFNEFLQLNKEILSKIKIDPDYVKGLAGNEEFEIKKYFKNYNNNRISIIYDNDASLYIRRTFEKRNGREDERKEWLKDLCDSTYLERYSGIPITISDFLNTDHLTYMYDACYRSIPSTIDGLKPSQRKILFTLLNKTNAYELIKVYQLTGFVTNFSNYCHGDGSMNGTIIGMAQKYCGSNNNVPLLATKGFFGSREDLGEDAGAPRYISVALSKIARYIFPKSDDILLKSRIENGCTVEPTFYIPIIPMALVNGSRGLGMGWSTCIPCYNVFDIIKMVKNVLSSKPMTVIKPYYDNFSGKIEVETDKILIYGKYELNGLKLRITEIPFTLPFSKLREKLKDLVKMEVITKNIKDNNCGKNSDLNKIDVSVTLVKELDEQEILRYFLLFDTIQLTNLNGFNKDYSIKHYNNIYLIIKEWFTVRRKLYIKRKDYIISEMRAELLEISNKARFIKKIVKNKLLIMKRKKADIEDDLDDMYFDKINNSYNYLLSMPIVSCTEEKYNELLKQYDNKTEALDTFSKTPIETIWISELEELENKLKQ